MQQQQVYFVGSETEIAHHAAPLTGLIDYQIAAPDVVCERTQPGDLAVFYSEHFDRFRDAISRLRSANVATLYMIDGILEWRNAWENRSNEPACPFTMRPVLADKVACIGASQARVLNSWGNEGKVEIVGIPRFDNLRTRQKRTRGNEIFRLLVMTAKCPSYTETDSENLHRALRDIRDYTNHRQGELEVVWRLTAGWNQHIGVENSLTDLTGDELPNQLATVDAVITTPSTAALESMMLDIPTAIIDYNNCPSYLRSAWQISAASQLEKQIAELRSPQESKLNFQRQLLADELYLESKAVDRMHDLVQQMLDISQKCIADGQPNAYPDQILNPPLSVGAQSVGFNHAALFSGFPEFQIIETTELQTALAHSRREIEHLKTQLAQLQSELNEAHQIFDEINGHPIAGPVVRIRQKLINILQRLKYSDMSSKTN